MADTVNEIDLVVGSMITMRPDEDRAAYQEELENVQDVQEILREEGIEVDLLSQPGTEVWEGGIESFYDLYQLKRLAAHLEQGDDPEMVLNSASMDSEEIDELLADIWEEAKPTRFAHLINHQGDGGYYLPTEFANPIWLDYGEEEEAINEDSAISFGSSVSLLRELTEVEQLFKQHNVPEGGHIRALQARRTAAQQSIDTGLPIILW